MKLRVHAKVDAAYSLGPGLRAGLWVQGCSQGCSGCFNPNTHPARGPELDVGYSDSWLIQVSVASPEVEGLTVSGGEPMEQAEAVLELLYDAKTLGLSRIMYTGWEYDRFCQHPLAQRLTALLDVLICGPFVESKKCGGMEGSSNKKVIYITDRYSPSDLLAVPEAELVLRPDGTQVWLGTCAPEVP